MFGGCCYADAQDPNESKFSFPSSTDESLVGESLRPGSSMKQADNYSPAAPKSVEVKPASEAPPSARSGRSLTAEEKEQEKVRLQTLVNGFAKKAVRGCPCVYFKEGSAERMSTHYRIDKSLEYLVLLGPKEAGPAEVTCPVAAIQDIYSLLEDGAHCFPQAVISQLSPEESDLLLMVVFCNNEGKLFRFCLLEASKESRDIFLECLRILCIYAQSGAR
eukprot:TRINITY_DN48267_c0_g1_i1.p1 TRINITY_DN48267_c0_g1~~TRINITY_DN48267_c0_g1_i1.p1  ORF type:complete len:219 (-),score=47.85 TRINITY_DN48267_c0_g1_i1:88-744(-)